MLEERDILLLEAYTYGSISAADEAALRERLAGDAGFAANVRRWELMEREGFVPEASLDIRKEVMAASFLSETSDKGHPPKQAARLNPLWKRITPYGVAAVALLLIYLIAVNLSSPTPAERLITDNFYHLVPEGMVLSSGVDEGSTYTAYNKREYGVAAQTLLAAEDGQGRELLYAGVAAIGDGNYALADSIFTALLRTGPPPEFAAETVYFRSLLDLRTGNKDRALGELKRISTSGGLVARKATALIEEINNNYDSLP